MKLYKVCELDRVRKIIRDTFSRRVEKTKSQIMYGIVSNTVCSVSTALYTLYWTQLGGMCKHKGKCELVETNCGMMLHLPPVQWMIQLYGRYSETWRRSHVWKKYHRHLYAYLKRLHWYKYKYKEYRLEFIITGLYTEMYSTQALPP